MVLVVAVFTVAGAPWVPAQEPARVPEPYAPEEFSASMQALRRAEIVAIGSYPFTLLFSILVYDYARWAGQGFAGEAAPFRRPLGEEPFSNDEKVGIAIGAAAAAVAIAAADYLLGSVEAAPPVPEPPAAARASDRNVDVRPLSHGGVLPVSLATVMQPAAGGP